MRAKGRIDEARPDRNVFRLAGEEYYDGFGVARNRTSAQDAMRSGALGVCLLFAAAPLTAQSASAESPVEAAIAKAELVRVGVESVELDISIEARSRRATRVRSFSFHGLTVNGMASYVAPVFAPVAIPAGAPAQLGPFRVRFYYRDMGGLAPLRRLVEEARVEIAGTARIEIELGWIERLALWTRGGVVWRTFGRSLPVDMPGGVFRELSAKALFALAEPLVQGGLALRRKRSEWFDETWDASMAHAAALRVSWAYRRRGQALVRVESVASATRVAPGRVLAPLEALEPWRFEPGMAYALRRGELELTGEREVELLLPPLGERPVATFRASRGELAIEAGKCDRERLLLLDENGKTRKTKVCRSSGERALATIVVRSVDGLGSVPGAAAPPAPGARLELGVLRLIRRPEQGRRWWEIVQLAGERRGAVIQLDEPVDRSALGAPLFVDGRLVGVVLHERGGVLLPRSQ